MQRPVPSASGTLSADAPAPAIVIRPLASHADYRACVRLQHEVWGEAFEAVPAAILQVAGHVGGISIGAFDEEGHLLGFVFGLTGVHDGRIIHWSHVLGVRPTQRNAGIGRLLKGHQRRELARRRVSTMYWTYDAVIAKNAHFNLNVLGARVVRFETNMYGESASQLHNGLATDRLIVECDTTCPPPREVSVTPDAADARTPVLTLHAQPGDRAVSPGDEPGPRLRLEIPQDFAQLLTEDPTAAAAWHATTREHFQWALARGYVVTGMRRDPATLRSFYMMELRATGPDTPVF